MSMRTRQNTIAHACFALSLVLNGCGRVVTGTQTVKSDTELEERLFEGSCQTIVLPWAPDDCECFLTDSGTQAVNDWQNKDLPPPQCSSDECSGQGKGGTYSLKVFGMMCLFIRR